MLEAIESLSCSTAAKYFLLKFADMSDGLPNYAGESFIAISEQMGLSRNQLYRIACELEEKELLERSEIPGATRPVVLTITGCPDNLQTVKERLDNHQHGNLIRKILGCDGPAPPEDRYQLNIPQRVLLIALLEQSNKGGMVRGLGYAKLATLTGLDKQRIRRQVESLSSYQFIRQTLHGGYSSNFMGEYYNNFSLNLSHPKYGVAAPASTMVICLRAFPMIQEDSAEYVFHMEKECSGRNKKNLGGAKKNQQSLSAPWKFLHWVMFDLASQTLANEWDNLPCATRTPRAPTNRWGCVLRARAVDTPANKDVDFSRETFRFLYPEITIEQGTQKAVIKKISKMAEDTLQPKRDKGNTSNKSSLESVLVGGVVINSWLLALGAKAMLGEYLLSSQNEDIDYCQILPPRKDSGGSVNALAIEIFWRVTHDTAKKPTTNILYFNGHEHRLEQCEDIYSIPFQLLEASGFAIPRKLPQIKKKA